eukprot:2416328-Amphidinium_carterae.5
MFESVDSEGYHGTYPTSEGAKVWEILGVTIQLERYNIGRLKDALARFVVRIPKHMHSPSPRGVVHGLLAEYDVAGMQKLDTRA